MLLKSPWAWQESSRNHLLREKELMFLQYLVCFHSLICLKFLLSTAMSVLEAGTSSFSSLNDVSCNSLL